MVSGRKITNQIRDTYLVDWNILIIALIVEMGIFNALAVYLLSLFYLVKLNNLVLHIRTIFFGFTVMDD